MITVPSANVTVALMGLEVPLLVLYEIVTDNPEPSPAIPVGMFVHSPLQVVPLYKMAYTGWLVLSGPVYDVAV